MSIGESVGRVSTGEDGEACANRGERMLETDSEAAEAGEHALVGSTTGVGVMDGRERAACTSMGMSCDGQESMAAGVGVGGLGGWTSSWGSGRAASLPAGCNDAARRRSSLSTSANKPSRAGGARRERHEAHTGLASTAAAASGSWRRNGALAASAERGQRQAKHSLTWDWGSWGGRSCMTGAACSAGMAGRETRTAGKRTQDGTEGGGRGEERSGECGRALSAPASAATPLQQSPSIPHAAISPSSRLRMQVRTASRCCYRRPWQHLPADDARARLGHNAPSLPCRAGVETRAGVDMGRHQHRCTQHRPSPDSRLRSCERELELDAVKATRGRQSRQRASANGTLRHAMAGPPAGTLWQQRARISQFARSRKRLQISLPLSSGQQPAMPKPTRPGLCQTSAPGLPPSRAASLPNPPSSSTHSGPDSSYPDIAHLCAWKSKRSERGSSEPPTDASSPLLARLPSAFPLLFSRHFQQAPSMPPSPARSRPAVQRVHLRPPSRRKSARKTPRSGGCTSSVQTLLTSVCVGATAAQLQPHIQDVRASLLMAPCLRVLAHDSVHSGETH